MYWYLQNVPFTKPQGDVTVENIYSNYNYIKPLLQKNLLDLTSERIQLSFPNPRNANPVCQIPTSSASDVITSRLLYRPSLVSSPSLIIELGSIVVVVVTDDELSSPRP